MLLEFHRRGQLHKDINVTSLMLIPKVLNPIGLKDIRPISLVGCFYKLLAKVLANRLKVVLPLIINHVQRGFCKRRQTIDGILIANELINSRKRSHKESVIFKTGLEKAYDDVNWNSFDYRWVGFSEKWRGWMRISSYSFSVFSKWIVFSSI